MKLVVSNKPPCTFVERLVNGDYSVRAMIETTQGQVIAGEIIRVPKAFNADPYRRATEIARERSPQEHGVYVSSKNPDLVA